MKKKTLSLALALVMCLGLTVPAFAAEETLDMSGFQYIQVSKNPISWVHITGTDYYGNPVDVVYLMLEDDTIITVNVPADAKEDEGAQNLHSIHMGDGDGDTFSESFSEPVDNDFLWYLSYRDEVLLYGAESYISSLANDLGYKVERISAEKAAELNDDAARFLAKINKNTTPVQPNKPDDTKPTTPPAAGPAVASPTNDALTADGVLQTPTVYKINGSNYFKIRDLAAILNGTSKQFSVGYDGALKSVTATTGQGYTKQPGDLAGAPAGGNKTAEPSNDAIYINGKKVQAEVYKIDGSNYFKLRDLGAALDFYVGYSAETGVFLETDRSYAG